MSLSLETVYWNGKFECIFLIVRCDGEPGVEGPGAGATVGTGEHCGVRRRPRERHAVRGDLRGHARSTTSPLTGNATPVQQTDSAGTTCITWILSNNKP